MLLGEEIEIIDQLLLELLLEDDKFDAEIQSTIENMPEEIASNG